MISMVVDTGLRDLVEKAARKLCLIEINGVPLTDQMSTASNHHLLHPIKIDDAEENLIQYSMVILPTFAWLS